MSVQIIQQYQFNDDIPLTNSALQMELNNIQQVINNANLALLTWDNVNATKSTIGTLTLTNPLAVANGGTNSSTALTSNRFIVSSAGKIVEASLVTASRAVASDTNGLPTASATTSTELSYVNGVTSAIQTQINTKQATLTAGQLPGTATNDSANAGNVGEYISSAFTASAAPATTTWGDATSISLTAGDWDIMYQVIANSNSVANVTVLQMATTTTTGNSTTGQTSGTNLLSETGTFLASDKTSMTLGRVRASLSGSATYYAKINASFTGTAPQFDGIISARRVR